MTDDQLIKQFVNDVYLVKFNRFVDTLTDASPDEDAVLEMQKVARWAAMFAEELELETDYEGRIMNWNFLRDNDVDLGVINTTSSSFVLPNVPLTTTPYRKLVVDYNRPLAVMQGTVRVNTFDVVDPNQITKRREGDTRDRVTTVGNKLIFSRLFRDYELNGHLIADAMRSIPRLTTTDASMLKVVPYYELMVLGVAKNATLPGIVEGGLSPALAQKYSALLDQAKADNENTSVPDDEVYDDYSSIAGVY
jgi:hypothetical protein